MQFLELRNKSSEVKRTRHTTKEKLYQKSKSIANLHNTQPGIKEALVDLDTQSMTSGISAARKAKDPKHTTRIIGGHGMAIRDLKKGRKSHKLCDDHITGKDFGKDDNDGHDAMQWKNREKDWYNAERRFIFATQKKGQRKDFLEKFNKDKVATSLKKGIAAMFKKRMKAKAKEIAQD